MDMIDIILYNYISFTFKKRSGITTMRFLKDLIVIILVSFTISFLVYLSLIPAELKPTTYKELTWKHFTDLGK